MSADPTTGEHVDRLRQYIRREFPTQHLYNRTWTMLAGARLKDLLSGRDRESLVTELVRRQRADGGWSLSELGPWRWNRQAPPFAAPSRLDASIVETSDGYATGLVVYTLIQNGIGDSEPSVARGLSWLRTNQRPVRVGDREPPAWRAHSLNYDREHGGEKGEAWRRLFMSDAATAFAVLALTSAR
jgi:hypothetical protein